MEERTHHLNHTVCDLESVVQSLIREYAIEKRKKHYSSWNPKRRSNSKYWNWTEGGASQKTSKKKQMESIIPDHSLHHVYIQARQNETAYSHRTKNSTKRITKSEQCGFPLDNQRRQLMNKNHPIINSQLPFSSVFIIKPHAVGLLTMGVTN